jgi:glycosyltransferase involved in cell wall biosynthesis
MSQLAVSADPADLPTVSVVMPCLDEAPHIEAALTSLLDDSYPSDRLECLVVDGLSRDGTREIVAAFAARDPRVRLVDNPRRITPSALNVGIGAARGEVLIRVDAHSRYPPGYIACLVHALMATGADLVGCAEKETCASTGVMARLIALSLGGAFATASPFRYRSKSGSADTVPFGCWRRETFDRVGLFDERLVRNQDYEHACRLRRAGGRVYLLAEPRYEYVARSRLRDLYRHAAATGMWNAFMQWLHPYTFRWRHFLPGLFTVGVLFCLFLALGGLVVGRGWMPAVAGGLLAPYALANGVSALWQARRARMLHLAPLVACIVFGHHFVYGWGICKGWLLVATGEYERHLGGAGP